VPAIPTVGPHLLSVETKNKNDWLNTGKEYSKKLSTTVICVIARFLISLPGSNLVRYAYQVPGTSYYLCRRNDDVRRWQPTTGHTIENSLLDLVLLVVLAYMKFVVGDLHD